MHLTTEHLQKLRDDARLERLTILEYRVRGGEDPAVAFEQTPELDDFVVAALRDELLEHRGQLAEYGLARLAARSSSPDASAHQQNADRVEFELLREIAEAVPSLAVAVWRAAGKLDVE